MIGYYPEESMKVNPVIKRWIGCIYKRTKLTSNKQSYRQYGGGLVAPTHKVDIHIESNIEFGVLLGSIFQ
jgi:hypothetical protein